MSVKVCIINIGNELLLGRTINTNLCWLGTQLAELGLPVTSSVTIMDEPKAIKDALGQTWQDHEIVIVTGGLGPTDDDLTKQVIAEFFGKKLEFREEVWKDVQEIFARRSLAVPEINRNQAMVPSDFTALKNTAGTAPGLYYSLNGKSVFALPGVPIEMKNLFNDSVKAILKSSYSYEAIQVKHLHTWNISESALAEKLKDIEIPDEIKLAWLPQTGRVDLRLYGANPVLINQYKDKIRELAKEWIWGEDEDTPQSVLHNILTSRNLTLAVAESCTGGLVQQLITSIPGASKYFLGGIVSYSNEVKIKLLNVKPETLEQYGAVSLEVAAEMASGVKTAMNSKIGISITGIAGPEGGTMEKPVGTVCFGIIYDSHVVTKQVIFNGNRESIRLKAAEFVILFLINQLRGQV